MLFVNQKFVDKEAVNKLADYEKRRKNLPGFTILSTLVYSLIFFIKNKNVIPMPVTKLFQLSDKI